MSEKPQQFVSDLERVNRSYNTGSQSYVMTEAKDERSQVTPSEDRQDSRRDLKYQLPSQE
jgi:hypothetical protein